MVQLQQCMLLIEQLQKTAGKNQPLFEESGQTSEDLHDNRVQDEILPGRLFVFLKKWLFIFFGYVHKKI